jgi:ketosteroid isomerase-like protein
MRSSWAACSALLLCGCVLRHNAPVPEPARGPARDSLLLVDQGRTDSVAARGYVAGMLASFAPQVVFLRAGAPIAAGLEAARHLLAASAEPQGTRMAWEPLGGGVSDDLRAAYTWGVTVRAGPASSPQVERYIAFWSRDARGPWRIIAYSEVNAPAMRRERVSDRESAIDTAVQRNAAKPVREARDQVRSADSSFSDLSYRMGIPYAFSNTAAPDAVIFGDPQLVVGPRAIQNFLESRSAQSSLVWQPVFAWVAGSRDLGFTIGEYTSTERGSSGAAIQRTGKYLSVWKHQSDGTWKFVVDGGNANPRENNR